MSVEIMIKAFVATYLLSAVAFMVLSYMRISTTSDRVCMILLWPLYIVLTCIYLGMSGLMSVIEFFLTAIWNEQFVDEDYEGDDDEDDETSK